MCKKHQLKDIVGELVFLLSQKKKCHQLTGGVQQQVGDGP